MEEIKKCPYCGEEILSEAKKCKHCGEWTEEGSRLEHLANVKQPGFFEYYLWEPIFKSYFDFKGKMPMKQYWVSILIGVPLFTLAFVFLPALLFGLESLNSSSVEVLRVLFILFIFIQTIACAVRRLRDTGKSPWWILIDIIPVIGSIWLILLLCKKGERISKSCQFRFLDFLLLITMLLCIVSPFLILA